tara:strand:- start:228 stop:719 length:492 start_codon:yes stop_codon:yes gene_type:complete
MAFTRYNYDDLRTKKILQESTGPCRYMLNVPGPYNTICYMDDPQMRLQGFGGNNHKVSGGHPIDIDSDLKGYTRQLYKYCTLKKFPNNGVVKSTKESYNTCREPITDQSRATHPARTYRSLPNKPIDIPLLNHQENTCFHFQNNLNTRLLERDNYVPKLPCLD